MHINDAINAAIADVAGDQNALPEKLLRYYLANGAVSLDRDDAEYEFLVAQGAIAVPGIELVSDPYFQAPADWTPGLGWSVSGGAAHVDGTQISASALVNINTIPGAGSGESILQIRSITPGSAGGGVVVGSGVTAFTPVYDTPGLHRDYAISFGVGDIRIVASPGTIASLRQVSLRGSGTGSTRLKQINDGWEAYLRLIKGYSGTLDDMLYQYWTVGPRP